jgi:hypothetical protein
MDDPCAMPSSPLTAGPGQFQTFLFIPKISAKNHNGKFFLEQRQERTNISKSM